MADTPSSMCNLLSTGLEEVVGGDIGVTEAAVENRQ